MDICVSNLGFRTFGNTEAQRHGDFRNAVKGSIKYLDIEPSVMGAVFRLPIPVPIPVPISFTQALSVSLCLCVSNPPDTD